MFGVHGISALLRLKSVSESLLHQTLRRLPLYQLEAQNTPCYKTRNRNRDPNPVPSTFTSLHPPHHLYNVQHEGTHQRYQKDKDCFPANPSANEMRLITILRPQKSAQAPYRDHLDDRLASRCCIQHHACTDQSKVVHNMLSRETGHRNIEQGEVTPSARTRPTKLPLLPSLC